MKLSATKPTLAVLAASALVLAACGSDHGGAQEPDPTTTQATEDPTEDPTDEPVESFDLEVYMANLDDEAAKDHFGTPTMIDDVTMLKQHHRWAGIKLPDAEDPWVEDRVLDIIPNYQCDRAYAY